MTAKPFDPGELRWTKTVSVQRYLRLAARLIRMSPLEIAHRLRLRIRTRYPITGPRASDAIARRAIIQKSIAGLGSDARTTASSWLDARFFFGPSQRMQLTAALWKHRPESVAKTIALAQSLLDGDGIDVLGIRVQLRNGTYDWHADPCSGKRLWPNVPLTEYEAIAVRGADVKYVWELNRQQ